MSVYWNLKKKSNNKYIVIQHPLKIQQNNSLCGVKFCGGYGVVAEGSKEYHKLKKIPMFKKAKELPLAFLKKAGFRLRDIQLVFGHDIYYHYLEAVGLDTNMKPIAPISREIEQPFVDVRVAELIEQNKEELDTLADNAISIPETQEEVLQVMEEMNITDSLPELTTEDIIAVHEREGLCPHVKDDGTVCENKRSLSSPGGFCFGHIRYDEDRLGAKDKS